MLILLSLVAGRTKDYYLHLQTGRTTSQRQLPTSWKVFSSVSITEQHLQVMNPEAAGPPWGTSAGKAVLPCLFLGIYVFWFCLRMLLQRETLLNICCMFRSREIHTSQSLLAFCFSSTLSVLLLAPASFWPWDLSDEGRASLGAVSGKPG